MNICKYSNSGSYWKSYFVALLDGDGVEGEDEMCSVMQIDG